MGERMKIVVLERNSVGEDVSVDEFQKYGEVTYYSVTSNDQVAERIRDADIVVSNKARMDAETMGGATRLKLVCQFATGYDNVDIGYCRERGIRVVNVRNYSTAVVVQHTFALALSVLENLPYYDGYVKSGAYSRQTRFTHYEKTFYELEGKTWGIVGMGNIGRRVAAAAQAFGCRIIFYSASGKSACQDYEQVDFDGLLRRSDILSLHCPLSERTRHLMDASAFERMKKEAILINVARGAVVDTRALAEALLAGKIRGAGLDVYEKEPMSPDDLLLSVADTGKLQMTPHMAWASAEARERCVSETCRNIEAFLGGEERNIVV